jgi:hypothetical protein
MEAGNDPWALAETSMAMAKITDTAVSNRAAHAALQAPAIHTATYRPTDMRVCSTTNRLDMKDCRVRPEAITQPGRRLGCFISGVAQRLRPGITAAD